MRKIARREVILTGKSFKSGLMTILCQTSSILNQTSKASLFLYGFVISIIPVLVLLVFNFLAFKGRYKFYEIELSHIIKFPNKLNEKLCKLN